MNVVRKKKKSESSAQLSGHSRVEASQSSVCPLKIDIDQLDVEALLAMSSECESYLMDRQTLALVSIHGQGSPFSSLIFIASGQIFKSKETTSTILSRFEKHMGLPRQIVSTTYQHYLGRHYRSPYGIGQLLFFPKPSISHRRHHHWFAYHHLLQYDYSRDQLLLHYPHQLTVTYEGNKRGGKPYFSYLKNIMALKSKLAVLMKTWLAMTIDTGPYSLGRTFRQAASDEDTVVDGIEELFSTLSEKIRHEALKSVAEDLGWELEDLEKMQE